MCRSVRNNTFFLGPFSEDYDFRINNTLYRILRERMNFTTAIQACQNELEGGGWVLGFESDARIDAIATELVIRHEGSELEYWVYGNITDNFTLSHTADPPQPGMLTGLILHETYRDRSRNIYSSHRVAFRISIS